MTLPVVQGLRRDGQRDRETGQKGNQTNDPQIHKLLALRIRIGIRGARQNFSTIAELDGSAIHRVGTIASKPAIDYEFGPNRQRLLISTSPQKSCRRAGFNRPVLNLSVLVLHIQKQPAVRISHLDFRKSSLDGNRLLVVKLCGKGVMRE